MRAKLHRPHESPSLKNTKTEENQKFKSEEKELRYLEYKTTRRRGILQVEDDRYLLSVKLLLHFLDNYVMKLLQNGPSKLISIFKNFPKMGQNSLKWLLLLCSYFSCWEWHILLLDFCLSLGCTWISQMLWMWPQEGLCHAQWCFGWLDVFPFLLLDSEELELLCVLLERRIFTLFWLQFWHEVVSTFIMVAL